MPYMSDIPTIGVKGLVGGSGTPLLEVRHLPGMSKSQISLGARIKSLRKARNLTQEALADFIGWGRSTIASWEKGHDVPGRDALAAMATFFGVSLDFFQSDALGRMPQEGEFVEDSDELALLRFWRGLSDEQKVLVVRLLGAADQRNNSAA